MAKSEIDNKKRLIEYIKLTITIPRVTYQLIKDKLYLPVDEDIICKAVRNGIEYKSVFDKIRVEIEALTNANPSYWHNGDMVDRKEVLKIIDKYIKEYTK